MSSADPLPEMLSATRLLCEYTLFCDAMALPEVRSVSHSVLIGAARLAPAPRSVCAMVCATR